MSDLSKLHIRDRLLDIIYSGQFNTAINCINQPDPTPINLDDEKKCLSLISRALTIKNAYEFNNEPAHILPPLLDFSNFKIIPSFAYSVDDIPINIIEMPVLVDYNTCICMLHAQMASVGAQKIINIIITPYLADYSYKVDIICFSSQIWDYILRALGNFSQYYDLVKEYRGLYLRHPNSPIQTVKQRLDFGFAGSTISFASLTSSIQKDIMYKKIYIHTFYDNYNYLSYLLQIPDPNDAYQAYLLILQNAETTAQHLCSKCGARTVENCLIHLIEFGNLVREPPPFDDLTESQYIMPSLNIN